MHYLNNKLHRIEQWGLIIFFLDKSDKYSFDQRTETSTHSYTPDMEVSSEVIYALFDKVRAKELLWNYSHTDYKSRNLKRTLVDEISKEISHKSCECWTETMVLSERLLCVA